MGAMNTPRRLTVSRRKRRSCGRMIAWSYNPLRSGRFTTEGKQRDIATALSASESAVSTWLAAAAQGGPDVLRARASPGRPARLSDAQLRLLPDFLWHGAEAYGFRGELWTCGRVAQVIEEEFGVRYHKGHVSRLLKALAGRRRC